MKVIVKLSSQKLDLPDGKYPALRYGYCIELEDGRLIKTDVGIRCSRNHAENVEVEVKDGNLSFCSTEVKKFSADDKVSTYTITCKDQEKNLLNLLEYIQSLGNVGHSFSIVVDPDDPESRKEFGWDGDGADSIKEIKED